MDKNKRKHLYKDIEERILAGEHKSIIYSEYFNGPDMDLVTRYLLLIPMPEHRKKYRILNRMLIASILILTAIKILILLPFVLAEPVKGAILLPFTVAINILFTWMIAKYRGIAYFLVIIIGIPGLIKLAEKFDKCSDLTEIPAINYVNLIFATVSIVLAIILFSKLLPQTSIFLKAKEKDGMDNPIF